MLLKTTKPTVKAYAVICTAGYNIEFENPLTQNFIRTTLESLILKLHRCSKRIRKAVTLRLAPGEALVLFWCCEWWIEFSPKSLEAVVANEYLINNDKIKHTINGKTLQTH